MPGSRFHPLFLVLALLFAHAALANKPWTFLCEKPDCSNGNCTSGQCSIINTASSSPSAAISLDTHVTVEFTTLDAVTEAEATAMAEKMCQAIFKTGLASAPPSPGPASASGGARAAPAAAAAPSAAIPSGLRPSSHQRRGIVLAGVTPDHPQYEMADVRENINGTDTVTGTARVLRQFTGDRHTLDFTDLPDRSGYQIATYRNADLGAPAAKVQTQTSIVPRRSRKGI